jgi:hypothetical protein
MKTLAVLLLLCLSVPAFAGKKDPCKPVHHAKPRPSTCAPAPKSESCLWKQLRTGFELEGGFRWDQEHTCPTLTVPNPPVKHTDPAFIGAQIRLPLNEYVGVFGAFDRDFVEAPTYQVRVGAFWRPFH